MAILSLRSLAKTSVDINDFIAIDNSVTHKSRKITMASLFPSMATTGAGGENLWISVTNKNQLNFKGLKSADTGLLTLATVSNNIELTVLEAGIDLSLCNNATSLFSTGVDFTSTITGENSVSHGGTGLSTIAKGAMLYASETDVISATTVPVNGAVLIGNATTGVPAWNTLTAGTGISIAETAGVITITSSLATMTSILDMASYNIDLHTNYISSDGATSSGVRVTGAHAYVGAASGYHDSDVLNLSGGGIRFDNTADVNIYPNATTSGTAGKPLILSAGSSANGNAGDLSLKAGTSASSTGNGGHVLVYGGNEAGGDAGSIKNYIYNGSGAAVQALTVIGSSANPNVVVDKGNLVISEATKGIVHTGSGTVTQATNHTTGCTINATSGVITLAAVALAATTNAEFTFTNSTIQADSVILLTMQDANTTNNAQLACALVSINGSGGDCVISIVNPHSSGASSATASKIHFLVINNS